MTKVIYTSQPIQCGVCTNKSTMQICGTVLHSTDFHDESTGMVHENGDMYSVLLCPNCSQINIAVSHWHEGMEDENELSYHVIYPAKERLPIGLPADIKKGYEAALRVKSIDANSYAVLLRRVLELVCIDRNAQGKDLYNKLDDLIKKNEIPANLAEVAQGLRDLGNVGAHAVIGEITEKEIPILRALINAVLEYVYSAPFLALIAKETSDKIKASK
jgi:hypothetical protein